MQQHNVNICKLQNSLSLIGCLLEKQYFRKELFRGVAQPGRAPRSGRGGRRFKSSHPDTTLRRCLNIAFFIFPNDETAARRYYYFIQHT